MTLIYSYLRVRHRCNNIKNHILNINNSLPEDANIIAGEQETKIVLPVFRKPAASLNGTIGNSTIFDWFLQHPIELSDNNLIIATTGSTNGLNGKDYNFNEENLEGDK